ncbi:MAG: prenyltransferase/squalene oxidase repeat-containing protein [Thermofilaceae archaeon]
MAGSLYALVDLDRVVEYVLSKRGSDGGYLSFQYMDMFESSAEDTFYALSILSTLKVDPPQADATIGFLRRLQDPSGGYRSVEVAYYSLLALDLLGAKPADPEGAARFLLGALEATLAEQNGHAWLLLDEKPLIDEKGVLRSKDATYIITPADVTPWLNRVSMIVLALDRLGGTADRYAEAAAAAMLKSRNGGGFGHPVPQLEYTYWAVEGLSALHRFDTPAETVKWVLACENESGGFSATPYSRNYFVENLYYGLKTLQKLGSSPRYARSHLRYVSSLQNANGGFRRTTTHGVSSLEYTFYAIESLKTLGLV